MRLSRLLPLASLVLVCLAARAATPLTLDSTHFRFIYFEKDQAFQANNLQTPAEEAYNRLEGWFGGFAPQGRVPVYLYSTRQQFLKETGTGRQEMVMGTASSANVIRLDASELFEKPASVIGHEVAHIFIFQFLGRNVRSLPLWLNEGLCQEAGGAPRQAARAAAIEAFSESRLASLAALRDDFPDDPRLNNYAQAQDAAAWLLNRGGWPNILKLMKRLQAGETFDTALEAVYDLTPDQLERGWRADLRAAALPRLWGDVAGYVIIALMLLALAWGFISVRRHRKRQHEEEEAQVTPPPAWWPDDDEWR